MLCLPLLARYVYGDWVSFRDAKATRVSDILQISMSASSFISSKYTVNFGLVSGLLADIIIAFFLSCELYRARPRS